MSNKTHLKKSRPCLLWCEEFLCYTITVVHGGSGWAGRV